MQDNRTPLKGCGELLRSVGSFLVEADMLADLRSGRGPLQNYLGAL